MVPVPLARAVGLAVMKAVLGRSVTDEERYKRKKRRTRDLRGNKRGVVGV